MGWLYGNKLCIIQCVLLSCSSDILLSVFTNFFTFLVIISNAIPERQLKHPLPFEKFKIKVYLPEKL